MVEVEYTNIRAATINAWVISLIYRNFSLVIFPNTGITKKIPDNI